MAEVETRVEGRCGHIVLNRPEALNALTLSMVRALRAAFEAFGDDARVAHVALSSSSPKAFCAGGDIRCIRELSLAGAYEEADRFFAEEFALNRLQAEFPKPVVAIVDGYAFGGGLALAAHSRLRVVTERAAMAMPETAIGYFPDVGASFFLPRLPGAVGMWMGLTGARVGGPDAERIGLATHFVSADQLDGLLALLAVTRDLETALHEVCERPPPGEFPASLTLIDDAFARPSVVAIMAALAEDGSERALRAAEALAAASPNSLRVTFELLARGRHLTLAECLAQEREAARAVIRHPDFLEGVRAALVDKDHAPRWSAPVPQAPAPRSNVPQGAAA